MSGKNLNGIMGDLNELDKSDVAHSLLPNLRDKVSSIPPKSIPDGGILNALGDVRAVLADRSKMDVPSIEMEMGAQFREKIGITKDNDVILSIIEDHIKRFPKEPVGGFKNVTQYGDYVSSLNRILSLDHALYKAAPTELRLRDLEKPKKFRSHIMFECADGRNSLPLYLPKNKLLGRFDVEWLPIAGVILFPEVEQPKNPKDIVELLANNIELKQNIFDRLDLLCGPKVAASLKDYQEEKLSRIYIEFQSHFNSHHYPKHGCGAHNSNLFAAQLESIKDCLITEEWLKDRYPKEFAVGLFKVFRTTHDTGIGKPIYSATKIDRTFTSKQCEEYQTLFADAGNRLESPVATNREEGVIRAYQGNPIGVETEAHDEQTIRISNLHLASTLMGQSVMEISWINDPNIMFEHVKVLIDIIEKNYQSKHSDKPIILHFDLVQHDQRIGQIYNRLSKLLLADPKIKKMLKDQTLCLWITETSRDTYETNVCYATE